MQLSQADPEDNSSSKEFLFGYNNIKFLVIIRDQSFWNGLEVEKKNIKNH